MQGCLKIEAILHKSEGNVREDRGITCTPGIVQLMWGFKDSECLRTPGIKVGISKQVLKRCLGGCCKTRCPVGDNTQAGKLPYTDNMELNFGMK